MSIRTKKPNMVPYVCRICGAAAVYSCFGAISCHPCKMFFKRNANAGQTALACNFDGQCEININNRHVCSACRLAKCFACGMSTDKLQGSRTTKPKQNALVPVQTQRLPERLPTLNLLQSDSSLLTIDQWTLLSNLFNCYNESQLLSFIQRLSNAHHAPQFTYDMYSTFVEEFSASIYTTTGAYLRSNDDFRRLSSDDRSIVLRSAADHVCCMGGAFIVHYCHSYGLAAFLKALSEKYGESTTDIHIRAKKFIDPDIVLIKLSISLFAFSENTCCYYSKAFQELTNPIHILNIQNRYAELTWKYLLYKYGYHESVKRFLNIALWLVSMNVLAVHAQTLTVHMHDIDSVIEQTELTLILDDAEEIIGTNQ